MGGGKFSQAQVSVLVYSIVSTVVAKSHMTILNMSVRIMNVALVSNF